MRFLLPLLLLCIPCAFACQPLRSAPPPTAAATASEPPTATTQIPEADSTALLALLSEHRAVSPPPSADPLEAPRDWKELPQSAVLWRGEALGGSTALPMVVMGGVVVYVDGTFVALDGETGEQRWERAFDEGSPHPDVREGCDGVVVLVTPSEIVGVEASSGDVRWSHSLEPRTDPLGGSGWLRAEACQVAFFRAQGTRRRTPDGPATLTVIDSRTGVERDVAECPQGSCHLVELSPGGVIFSVGDERYFAPTAGAQTQVPEGTHYVAGSTWVTRSPDEWRGLDAAGIELWKRDQPLRPVIRIDNSMVAVANDALIRFDLRGGDEMWSIPLSDELVRLMGRRPTADIDGRRLVLSNRTEPDLLLFVDAEDGGVEALRLAPQDPVNIGLDGDLLIVAAHDETVAVRVDREAPAIRERLSLAADVAQAIGELSEEPGRPPEATRSGHIPAHLYPAGSNAARIWLGRLGPLAHPMLFEVIRTGTLASVADVLWDLGGAEEVEVGHAVEHAMSRALGSEGTSSARARVIQTSVEAFGYRTLDRTMASDLADQAIEWLQQTRPELDACVGSDTLPGDEEVCRRIESRYLAVGSTYTLLARASRRSEPIRRLRAAIVGDTGAAVCTPSDDDAARVAVIEHLLSLQARPPTALVAPGIQCAQAFSIHGSLNVLSQATNVAPRWTVEAPAEVVVGERPVRWGDPQWDTAPMRAVVYSWYRGPLAAEGGIYYVLKMDGVWRVVGGGMNWIS